MIINTVRASFWALLLCLNLGVAATVVQAQSTEFTYQGSLRESGAPASGNYDFEFALYNAVSGGAQIGTTLTRNAVAVTNGTLNIALDFGSVFPGAERYLEIRTRLTGQPAFTTLSPRQRIGSVPYSVKSLTADSAATAGNVSGVISIVNGGTGSSTQNFVDLTTNQSVGGDKTFTGTISGVGSGLTNLNGANIAPNSVAASALAPDALQQNPNYSRLGSRRWDLLKQRVAVGINPNGIAFDGANIWVANTGSNNVMKIRTSDGTIQGTYPVGTAPKGVEVDGTNVWIVNSGSNDVTKLRTSDGAPQGTFAVGTAPAGITFDGANLWVTNNGSNNVTKLRASDGALQGTYSVGTAPEGITFDGVTIWVGASTTVTKLRAIDGASQGTITLSRASYGLAFDGGRIWSTNPVANTSSPNGVSLITVGAEGNSPAGTVINNTTLSSGPRSIVYDGADMWIANSSQANVQRMSKALGIRTIHPVDAGPTALAFDGTNIWVACSTANTVVRVPVFHDY